MSRDNVSYFLAKKSLIFLQKTSLKAIRTRRLSSLSLLQSVHYFLFSERFSKMSDLIVSEEFVKHIFLHNRQRIVRGVDVLEILKCKILNHWLVCNFHPIIHFVKLFNGVSLFSLLHVDILVNPILSLANALRFNISLNFFSLRPPAPAPAASYAPYPFLTNCLSSPFLVLQHMLFGNHCWFTSW